MPQVTSAACNLPVAAEPLSFKKNSRAKKKRTGKTSLRLNNGGKKKRKTKAELTQERTWKTEWFKPSKNHPYALAGANAFVEGKHRKLSKKSSKNLSWNQLKQKQKTWLQNQDTYQLHRPAQKHYPRRTFGPVYAIGDSWQMDLSDMSRNEVKEANGGVAWILFAIDVLSRKAWAIGLKNKSGKETARGVKAIFDLVLAEKSDHSIPRVIYVDRGSEFYNKDVKSLLTTYPIPPLLHLGNSTTKAAIVERLQRTIKSRLWKHFYHTGSYKWVDVLPQIIEGYNFSKHRSIGRAPIEVNKSNEEEVWNTLYGDNQHQRERFLSSKPLTRESYFKFDVGDVVRISVQAQIVDKSYLPQWSEEWFRIRARHFGPPAYYRLKEYQGEEILEGTFYDAEMQLVDPDKVPNFRVESVLKRRTDPKGKKKQVFVKYKGWPDSYNQWIDAKDVKALT